VAAAIEGNCRKYDLPVRYGGEEFAILVPDEAVDGAVALAQRCRARIEAIRLDAGGTPVQTTASFGVSQASDAEFEEDLIRLADQALYRAKQAGGNRVERATSLQAVQVQGTRGRIASRECLTADGTSAHDTRKQITSKEMIGTPRAHKVKCTLPTASKPTTKNLVERRSCQT